MNLNEMNFAFNGKHCLREFGCIYVEDGGHVMSPAVTRNTYEIAGVDGTVELDGETYAEIFFSGTLFFWKDPPSQAAAQRMLRRINAWLLAGRKRLVFDYEPERFYLAEVNHAMEWNYDKWIEGGHSIRFTAQPYACNVRENSVSVTTAEAEATLRLAADTGAPAPLCVDIQNTGTAPITAAEITIGEKAAVFSGMSLPEGQTLTVSMEPPAGAVFSDGENALPYAAQFDPLFAQAGSNEIGLTLAYGDGIPGASITAKARGRFL